MTAATNGDGPEPEVDQRLIIESLGQQVARLAIDVAVREAVILGLRAELAAKAEPAEAAPHA